MAFVLAGMADSHVGEEWGLPLPLGVAAAIFMIAAAIKLRSPRRPP